MQASADNMPAAFAAASGDVVLKLDCGGQMLAHSAFLLYTSSVLAEAISLADQPAEGNKQAIPVHCVSSQQLTLLLQVGKYFRDLCGPDLQQPATAMAQHMSFMPLHCRPCTVSAAIAGAAILRSRTWRRFARWPIGSTAPASWRSATRPLS